MSLFPTRSPLSQSILIALVALSAAPAVMAEESSKETKDPANATQLATMVVTDKKEQKKADPKLAAARVEANQSAGGVTIVDVEDFQDRNVSSLADFFRYVPGMWAASQSGNDEVFFSSRGSNLDSTNFDGNGV
ncbi:MAG: TonB-dependent receptor plug domain-containing protein, partial [Methylococcales bacterium]|nr:TonB-dependent receptor plug domain-containing protein [Methylococcales bacterium]